MTDTQTSKAPEEKPRRLRFWLLTGIGVLIVLPVVLIGALLLALRSETGTAWVIDQVPGLTVTEGQGSLFGQWQADDLHWRGFGVDVTVRAPLVDWSPSCLFGKELCLEKLEARNVDVSVLSPTSDDGPRQAINLPMLNLPLSMTIGSVDIGSLVVNQQIIWDRFRFSANGSGSDWLISQLSVQRGEIALDVSGRLTTRGDWPLDLAVEAEIPPLSGDRWLLDLNLTGSVAQLLVRGNSQGYLNAALSGQTEPLKPSLPARLRVQTKSFKAAGNLPDTLTLLDTDLVLDGSLEDGFQLDGDGQLAGTNGNIGFGLKGLLTTTGLQALDLNLTGQGVGDAKTGTAEAKGKISWEQELAVDAKVVLDAFPWFSLLPGVEEPPVILKRLDADLAYQGGRYSATLEAAVDGPQGSADLASNLKGDLESLELTNLKVTTAAGSLTGVAQLGFAGPLTWQTTLELSQFDPGYWVPALEASLNGEITSEGKLSPDGPPTLQATWDLTGSWRASEAIIRGRLDQDGPTLFVSDLDVQVDENRIAGNGQWGPELAADLQLELPQPQILLPALEGALSGRVQVGGTTASPLGSVSLTGKEVGWNGQISAGKLDVAASLSPGEAVKGDVMVSDIKAVGQSLESLSLNLSGTRENHRLSINAVHEEADLLFSFAGGVGPAWSTWTGQLAEGEINVTSQDQFWRLNESADLSYNQAGQLTFGAHCWIWDQASVCAGSQTLLPQPGLNYQIRKFPTTALSPLLPDTLRWETLLDADLAFQTSDAGRDGSLSVDAGSGQFSVLNGEEWEKFEYSALTARVALLPERADLSLALEGPRLGSLAADVSVDPQSQERTLDGSFRVSDLDIALAAVFAGLEEVRGQLRGQGRISGPLMKPAVNGELILSGGEISDPSLPLPVEQVFLSARLQGYEAAVSGRWKSNERSSGELNGTVSWGSGLDADLKLSGRRLPFRFEPYASVEVEPDLRIAFNSGALSISGQVAVPRGEIEITKLPEQAVSVSDDEVIVGTEQEQPEPLSVNMEITVVVGEDRVSFNGFEITGNLDGTLRISNDMDTRGSLRLNDGRYEAYGQELELRRARLIFTGPLTQPYLDIEAIRRVDTVVAGIRLTGPISQPRTEVFAEPSMPQTDALSYLILGRPARGRGEGDDGQMRNAAISLGLSQAAGVTRGVGEELGIEDLTLEAEGSGDEAAVVASGYLTDELSVRYGVGIFEPITTVALRYDLGRYFYLEAASGLAASLDIFYTRDF